MQMKMKVISSILNTCLCKKLSTLAVIALCCVSVFGQKQKALTGKWLGTLTQTPTVTSPVFYFELYLEEKDGQLQGYSLIYYQEFFSKMSVVAIESPNKLTFMETKIIDYSAEVGTNWCLKTASLSLKTDGQIEFLVGDWEGYSTSGPCNPGHITLKRETDRDTTTGIVKKSDVEKEDGKVVAAQGRKAKKGNEIILHHKDFKLFVYDHLKEDGDVVALIFNDELVLNDHLLKKAAIQFPLSFDDTRETNYLVLHALNLGRYPPNTATIKVVDGEYSQTLVLESDLDHSDLIYFRMADNEKGSDK